jgi:ComF family protein
MRNWAQKLNPLLELFLESKCPLCQRSTNQDLCQSCRQQVQRCQSHSPWGQETPPILAWGVYGGALKRSIAALKYENQPQIARLLGDLLGQTWLEVSAKEQRIMAQPIVVPIPLHPDKQKQRGYNQAELLAIAFCQTTGLPLQRHGLARTRATTAQFGLSIAERNQNLTDAFQLGQGFLRHLPSRPVLLIDDIYTTGATARSAIQTLEQHQISVCGLAAIARPVKG